MRCSKRGFFVISFSLLFSVAHAASSALPGPEGFPPFPLDQEMREEDFSDVRPEPKPDSKPDTKPEPKEIPEPPADELPEDNDNNPKLPLPPLPPKDSDKIFYYRGQRTYSEDLPLKVNFIRCIRGEDGQIILMIIFNQSVNPRSVNHSSILIDGTELSENIRFSFNRKGDTIRLVLLEDDEEFLVTIQNVSAFNGANIEPTELLAEVDE